jgi:hypothetical protein
VQRYSYVVPLSLCFRSAHLISLSSFHAAPGPAECPLGVYHPPNGTEEFCLGCVLCRAIQSDSGFHFKGQVNNA